MAAPGGLWYNQLCKLIGCVSLNGAQDRRDIRIHKALIAHDHGGNRFVAVGNRANDGRSLRNLPDVHGGGRHSRRIKGGAQVSTKWAARPPVHSHEIFGRHTVTSHCTLREQFHSRSIARASGRRLADS